MRIHLKYLVCIFLLVCLEAKGQHDSIPPDSIHKKRIQKFFPSGEIGAGYKYGLVPYIVGDSTAISSYLQTEGHVDVQAGKLPLDISFFYTSLRNITGLNNYFRVSFDVERYREQMLKRIRFNKNIFSDRLDSLYKQRQLGNQKLLYTQHLLTNGWKGYVDKLQPDSIRNPLDTIQNPFDSLTVPEISLPDSLKPDIPGAPSLDTAAIRDSLLTSYTEMQQQLQFIEAQINNLKAKKRLYDSLSRYKPDAPELLLSKQNFLQSIKKFEIGLCYPDFSPLLSSGIVLKGLLAEFNSGRFYTGIVAGKTLNNLLFTTNTVSNQLNNQSNLFNYFDFGNVTAGRNIVIVKVGPGSKTGTHFHLGLLLGKGLASYMTDSNQVLYSNEKEINQVAEADARWQINNNHSLHLIYAKSLTAGNPVPDSVAWLDSKYHSHAAFAKYEANFPKLKSKLTAQVRWIDAFFKSYGVAFVRPDNLRYEIKTDHTITYNLKLGTLLKEESNNLRGVYAYGVRIYSAGISVSYKPVKSLLLKLQYRPVIMRTETEAQVSLHKNKIATAVINWSPRTGRQRNMFTAMYNQFDISNGVNGSKFKFASLSSLIPLHRKTKLQLSSSYYNTAYLISENNASPDSSNESHIHKAELLFSTSKGLRITAGGKTGWSKILNWQYGWSASLQWPLGVKGLELTASVEKLLYGDFFNSFDHETFQRFPYMAQSGINLSW